MTVYYLVLPAAMPPYGLLHLLGPLRALAPPRRANRPLSDPLCIHILNVASTTVSSALNVSTCTACRSLPMPKRLCGHPSYAQSPFWRLMVPY